MKSMRRIDLYCRGTIPVFFLLLFLPLLGALPERSALQADNKRGGSDRVARFVFRRRPKMEEGVRMALASRPRRRCRRDDRSAGGAATAPGEDEDDCDRCSPRGRDRGRLAAASSSLLSRRGRRKRGMSSSSRWAYRMAILASLAYRDFRDGGGSGWASFALADDPTPSRYLTTTGSADADGKKATPRSSTSSSSSAASRDDEERTSRSLRRMTSGIVDRFRVKLCQTRHGLLDRIAIRKAPSSLLSSPRLKREDILTKSTTKDECKRNVLRRKEGGKRYNVEWVLSDWHEETTNIRWHDTDLIIATSGTSDLVIAFAGTASTADAVTNIQTLEPASHSGLFDRQGGGSDDDDARNSTAESSPALEGNVHRGYLNAYARVVRGKIRRLNNDNGDEEGRLRSAGSTLDDYYNECLTMQRQMNASIDRDDAAMAKIIDKDHNKMNNKIKRRRKRHQKFICRSSGRRLMDILRNVTTSALRSGRNVHLVGHSLGGALATIHALDVAMNYDRDAAPTERLHLWTFGAPEVADSLFFESAGYHSRRMSDFFADPGRHHRYVTRSTKNCGTDVVASITSSALNRGRALRRLGGVRGDVIHVNEPSFLLSNATGVELHELRTYLRGISSSGSSSPENALRTDFPSHIKSWLGEEM